MEDETIAKKLKIEFHTPEKKSHHERPSASTTSNNSIGNYCMLYTEGEDYCQFG